MNLSFRSVKGLQIKKQGLVYYAMMNRRHSAAHVIKACEDALDSICKNEYDKKMMREYVASDATLTYISVKYGKSTRTIQRLYRKYLEKVIRSITNV